MWPFRKKIGVDYIKQMIPLAIRLKEDIKKGDNKNARNFLEVINRITQKTVEQLELETGKRELVLEAKKALVLVSDALYELNSKNKSNKVVKALDSIIKLKDWVKLGSVRPIYTEENINFLKVTPDMWPQIKDDIIMIEHTFFQGSELEETPESLEELATNPKNLMIIAIDSEKSNKVIGFVAGKPLETMSDLIFVKQDPEFGTKKAIYLTATEILSDYNAKGTAFILRIKFAEIAASKGYTQISSHNRQGASIRNALRMGAKVLKTIKNYYNTRETYYYTITNLRKYGNDQFKLAFKSVKQQKDYTCGPASLKAVLHYYNKNFDEAILEKLTGSTEQDGTSHEGLITAAKKCGLKPMEKSNATIEDINEKISQGMPVIVNYYLPEQNEGHYSVIIGYNAEKFIILDVEDGKEKQYDKKEFEKNWFSKRYGKKWMMALQN